MEMRKCLNVNAFKVINENVGMSLQEKLQVGVSFSPYMEIRIDPSANALKAIHKNVGVSYNPYMEIRKALSGGFFFFWCVFLYGNERNSKQVCLQGCR